MASDGKSPVAGRTLALWEERHERIRRALAYEPVDRIPFTFMGGGYSPVSQGLSLAEFCTDADAAVGAILDCLEDLGDIDGANQMYRGLTTPGLTALWLSRIAVPGIDLPDDVVWQVHETEDLTVGDYDRILDEGWEPVRDELLGRLQKPELVEANDRWVARSFAGLARRYHERGYDTLCGATTTIPFEVLCGGRSMARFYVDCLRMPEKVKAVMDVVQPFYVAHAVRTTAASGVKSTWVGGWRAASGLVSPRIWDELVWPYYVDMVTRLHEQGIFSLLHFDQNWDRDVHRFLELPRRSFAVAFDGMTDIRRAKEILGDHCAFLGDVPSSMLAIGTPDQVRAYVRDLIRDLGPTGLVMNPGCDVPFNARPENVRAMVAATHEFGTFA